jgi:hypothetical protein
MGAEQGTQCKFDAEYPKLLGATVRDLAAWRPGSRGFSIHGMGQQFCSHVTNSLYLAQGFPQSLRPLIYRMRYGIPSIAITYVKVLYRTLSILIYFILYIL